MLRYDFAALSNIPTKPSFMIAAARQCAGVPADLQGAVILATVDSRQSTGRPFAGRFANQLGTLFGC